MSTFATYAETAIANSAAAAAVAAAALAGGSNGMALGAGSGASSGGPAENVHGGASGSGSSPSSANGGTGGGQDDANGTEGGKKKKTTKRRKVNHACLYCRRSHMTCDEGRPCQRWLVSLSSPFSPSLNLSNLNFSLPASSARLDTYATTSADRATHPPRWAITPHLPPPSVLRVLLDRHPPRHRRRRRLSPYPRRRGRHSSRGRR